MLSNFELAQIELEKPRGPKLAIARGPIRENGEVEVEQPAGGPTVEGINRAGAVLTQLCANTILMAAKLDQLNAAG